VELVREAGNEVDDPHRFSHVQDEGHAIAQVPKTAWKLAVTATGEPQEHSDVVEITGMLNLKKWPVGMRVLIRREHPHPGASLTLFEHADGWRHQGVATNTPVATGGQVAFLEAATAPTRASRPGSGTPKTPASAGSRPASTTSTPPGPSLHPSPPTSSRGCGYSPYLPG